MEIRIERLEVAGDSPGLFEKALAEKVSTLAPGEILELVCPQTDADVRVHNWCYLNGFSLLGVERQGGEWRLRIQRASVEQVQPSSCHAPVQSVIGRREALTFLTHTLMGGLALTSLEGRAQEASSKPATDALPLPLLPEEQPNEDVIARMMRDLQRALKKPVEQRRWVMVIDLRRCVACHACTVSCIAENKLPPGVVYRPVVEEEIGTYPNVARRFIPRPCMQCDSPPCVPVCPVGATWKGEDGIVHIDYDACIGCRYCITACPYGARTFDFGEFYTDGTPRRAEYDEAPSFEYGEKWTRGEKHPLGEFAPKSPIGNARKCHFCIHRVERGMLPMCVTTCIGRATYFGDANDPESLVAQLIAQPNVMRLKEELGTKPRVYYLV